MPILVGRQVDILIWRNDLPVLKPVKKDNHIDPELFDLFLRSGVYMDYARRFPSRDQIDEVDLKAYLS